MVYISGGNELIDPGTVFKHIDIKAGDRLADLGCGGAAHFVVPAAQKIGSQGLVYAVDILKSALKSVASISRLEGVQNVKTIWSNLEITDATTIKKESLDAAFLINILFQSKQHENIIKEAVRLIKRGGQLLVIDWGRGASTFGPPVVDRVKPENIKKIAQNLKLKLLDEFEAGTYHFGLVFKKVTSS